MKGESFAALKIRAETAERRVVELELEIAVLRASKPKYEEPLSSLVQAVDPATGKPIPGHWEYRKEEKDEGT